MQRIKEEYSKYEPPKKPSSAYIIFQIEKRESSLSNRPNAKVTEVVKEIARSWK